VVRKLRRGTWTIQPQRDLHGYRVEEAREALRELLRGCVKLELRCVRMIHGKGLGLVQPDAGAEGKRAALADAEKSAGVCGSRAE
jgi:DNA-nicking Smr family endonuclease